MQHGERREAIRRGALSPYALILSLSKDEVSTRSGESLFLCHGERSEAIQNRPLDCFVAYAPRNDGNFTLFYEDRMSESAMSKRSVAHCGGQ